MEQVSRFSVDLGAQKELILTENFSERINVSNQKKTRILYGKVNESRNDYRLQPLLCKDKNGLILADEERCRVV